MKLSDAADLAWKVFGVTFTKSDVIALWREQDLMKFTPQELESLRLNAERDYKEATGNSYKNMIQRLLSRIDYVRITKEEEAKRESNRDSDTNVPQLPTSLLRVEE